MKSYQTHVNLLFIACVLTTVQGLETCDAQMLNLSSGLSAVVYFSISANNDVPSVDEAIELVKKPADGFANMSPFELQVHYRLMWLLYNVHYKYEDGHAESWNALMRDENENMYARLCAAYFLLDQQQEAREFIAGQLKSDNLRHRYNAAEVVEIHVGRDPSKNWGIATLIKLVGDGTIDGSGISVSPPGKFPLGDRDDIMMTPIDAICWSLGYMKEKNAVPALISVLERRPQTGGAAFALGEIGDERAIPILLKILKEQTGYEDREVTALGKLKSKEAVPILISRLGHPKRRFGGTGVLETEKILEALLLIGDERAITPIEEYLDGAFPKESQAVAKRVLAQLSSSDPVKALLDLLEKETYEPERSDIISALTKYSDDRVVGALERIARTSDSAYMRREAIFGLRDLGDRKSLLVLASLLDVTFSKDLKAEWGWKGTPDFQEYFPDTIARCLKYCTKQDFGRDRAKWEHWITESFETQNP